MDESLSTVDTLSFAVYNKSLRPNFISDPRIVVKVSRHMFNIIPSSNLVKYSPSFWLSILVRKYGVILNQLSAIARGVTHTK